MSDTYKAIIQKTQPGLAITSFSHIGEGEDNIAFAINGSYIARFAKNHDPAEEVSLLKTLAVHAVLPVPNPIYYSSEHHYFMYENLPGVPILNVLENFKIKDWPDLADQIGDFIRSLQKIEPSLLPNVPHESPDAAEFLSEAKYLFDRLRDSIPQAYHSAIQHFLSENSPAKSSLVFVCHNDLGAEHILVDEQSKKITGIIDWSDIAFTDPARDFGRLYRDFGPELLQSMQAYYPAEPTATFLNRVEFYAKCGALEDFAYSIDTQNEKYVQKSLRSFTWLFPTVTAK